MRDAIGRRLFAADYSSSGQRNWPRSSLWKKQMIAQLRCDVLAYQRVVIPDTHLLDGALFMGVRPSTLATELGLTDPLWEHGLELRLRASTVREALAKLLVVDGSENLNAFPFKLLADYQTRSAVAALLGRTPRASWGRLLSKHDSDPAKALGQLLRATIDRAAIDTLQVSRALREVDEAEAHWSYWVESAEAHFPVKGWDRPYSLLEAMECDPIDDEFATVEGRSVMSETLRAVRAGHKLRADLSARIAEMREGSPSENLRRDLSLCERWYSRARYRAIATQHGCAIAYDASLSDGAEPFGLERCVSGAEIPRGSLAQFPIEFQNAVIHADAKQFYEALRASATDLVAWWEEQDYAALRRTADLVAARLGCLTPSPSQQRVQTFVKRSATIAAAGAGALLTGTTMGALAGGVTGLLIAAGVDAVEAERSLGIRDRIVEGLAARGAGG